MAYRNQIIEFCKRCKEAKAEFYAGANIPVNKRGKYTNFLAPPAKDYAEDIENTATIRTWPSLK